MSPGISINSFQDYLNLLSEAWAAIVTELSHAMIQSMVLILYSIRRTTYPHVDKSSRLNYGDDFGPCRADVWYRNKEMYLHFLIISKDLDGMNSSVGKTRTQFYFITNTMIADELP